MTLVDDRAKIQEALRQLALRCDGAQSPDGVGFNSLHARPGQYLAWSDAGEWDDATVREAWGIAANYKRQLEEYGIKFDVEQPPFVDWRPADFQARTILFYKGEVVAFDFNYDPEVNKDIKRIPGRKPVYNDRGKFECWTAPAAQGEALRRFASKWGFVFSAGALAAMERAEEAGQSMAAPPEPEPKPRVVSNVEWNGTVFLLRFEKEEAGVLADVRALSSRRFVGGDDPCWVVPHECAAELRPLLERNGFVLGEGVAEALANAPARCRVEVDGEDGYKVIFPYDPPLAKELQRCAASRTPVKDSNDRFSHWRVSIGDTAGLRDFIYRHPQFKVDAAVHAMMQRQTERTAEQLEASRAEDAEIEIPTLNGTLRPFQRGGVSYAIQTKRTFIADEQGLGKTVQALATFEALNAYPAVVVCPSSLKLNWRNEARRFLPHRQVQVLDNQTAVDHTADIYVINYDILAAREQMKGKRIQLSDNLIAIRERGLKAVAFDESHYLKNGKARRTRAAKALVKGVDVRLALTGTPVLNRPVELVSQLEVIGRLNDFGGFWPFVKEFCRAHQTAFGWDMSGASNLDELNRKLRATCMVRRTKDQVLKELPPKQRSTVIVPINNRPQYERALTDLIAYLRETKGQEAASAAVRAEHLVRINALLQLAAQGKLKTVLDWIADFLESGEKLVVFGVHVEVVKAIAQRFDAPCILGETEVEDRQAAVDCFQNDPDCRLIVGNLQAMGVGHTLTAASNVAIVELGWTPAVHDQAEDRIHRIGQEQSANVHYLISEDTIEEWMVELIEKKRAVVTAVTDGGGAGRERSILGDVVKRLLKGGK